METTAFPSLESLADIGLRGGVDMRPTLIRVLTDLYVQKLRHTPEEERHYTELALRLLDRVDVPTRIAVASRLARQLSPPERVVQYLVNDLPEIAAALRAHALLQPAARAEPTRRPHAAPRAEDSATRPERDESSVTHNSHDVDPAIARELNDQFFDASEYERRLILLNLHVVVPVAAGCVAVMREPGIGQRLEAAALGHYREDLAKQLAHALHISAAQARRIARDDLGEPIAVAVKALGVKREVVHRILMFFNPAVGHSVERVHALATLFDEMTLPAAEGMVAIWQALPSESRTVVKHQPASWNDARSQARPAAAARQPPLAAAPARERRDAS